MIQILRMVGVVSTVMLILAYRADAQPEKSQAVERFASFEMTWPKQKVEAVATRARAAAEAMTGQEMRRTAIVVPIKSASDTRRMQVTVPGAPALEILYLPDYDELRIGDTELAVSTAPVGEMPQDEALKLAKRVFDALAHSKLVNPRYYAWDSADVASTWVDGGSLDGKTVERKRIEYRIALRPLINGIELANAGVRIAIHTSGRMSGLRLGGVAVLLRTVGDVEEPIGKGRWLSRQLEFPSDSGKTVVSRRRTVGFSLVNPKALPVDLTPPLRAAQTEKNRKRPVENP